LKLIFLVDQKDKRNKEYLMIQNIGQKNKEKRFLVYQ
jgi:hypothetical protein